MSVRSPLGQLFREEAPKLRRVLRRFGGHISSEDILQESFLRLFSLNSDQIESPNAYLFRTARNLALDDCRHRRAVPISSAADMEDVSIASETLNPEEALICAEERRLALTVLNALPADLRTPLVLHRLEGLSHDDIASRLGLSRRTVQRRIAEAIARCHLAISAATGDDC